MKKILYVIPGILLITNSFALDIPGNITNSNKDLLPSPFPVYVIEGLLLSIILTREQKKYSCQPTTAM